MVRMKSAGPSAMHNNGEILNQNDYVPTSVINVTVMLPCTGENYDYESVDFRQDNEMTTASLLKVFFSFV